MDVKKARSQFGRPRKTYSELVHAQACVCACSKTSRPEWATQACTSTWFALARHARSAQRRRARDAVVALRRPLAHRSLERRSFVNAR